MSNRTTKLKSKYSFTPSLKLSIVTLLLFLILVYLGTWQIGRAHEKQNILLNIQKKTKLPPVKLETMSNPGLINDRFTPVTIKGVFLNHQTFLLDNQMLNHKAGFRVLTPMQTPKLKNLILIDRGWVPANTPRTILPKIETIYGMQEINGLINSAASGIILKKDLVNLSTNWPVIIQSVDYEFISQQLQHPLYKFVIQLQSSNVDLGISPAKHLGYAMQWFIFASLAIVYFLIASIKRKP